MLKTMPCDMCGNAKIEAVCSIEGSELTVCGLCSKYGQIIRRVGFEARRPMKAGFQPKPQKVEELVSNFAQLIKSKRESLKMTQEDFAKKLQEKEGVVHKWETGHLKPDFQTAKKLERLLGIKLVTVSSAEPEKVQRRESAGLTIGDILKV